MQLSTSRSFGGHSKGWNLYNVSVSYGNNKKKYIGFFWYSIFSSLAVVNDNSDKNCLALTKQQAEDKILEDWLDSN